MRKKYILLGKVIKKNRKFPKIRWVSNGYDSI
jgi:hypothetical protein